MNLNTEKKTKPIEKNSHSSMASTGYVNMNSKTLVDLKEKSKKNKREFTFPT